MPRTSRRLIPACPTLFTPLQVHVREVLRIGVVSWVGWMRDHVLSLQRMIKDHGFAVVVAGASVEYLRDCLFPDTDALEVDTTSSVHRRGVLIEGVSTFSAGNDAFARMRIYFRPVQIGDEHSAAAKSADLPEHLRALFSDDEIAPGAFPRPVKGLVKALEDGAEPVGTWTQAFKLHRYAMDFADQWAFMETAAFVSASREELAMASAAECSLLLDALSNPVKEYHVELSKPYFVMDTGVVRTQAFQESGSLSFVHRLMGPGQDGLDVHAIVVEKMCSGSRVTA